MAERGGVGTADIHLIKSSGWRALVDAVVAAGGRVITEVKGEPIVLLELVPVRNDRRR